MSREMLINVHEKEECRVAVMEDGVLEELYVERASQVSHVGNVYKGRITNIEPSIQAVFVDFGLPKNGFLHISDVHPRYFDVKKGGNNEGDKENIGKRRSLKERPPIQQILKKGQEIIVQVTKEGIGTKGPTLTTYLSLPGKYLVMMAWMEKVGVSQKIDDEKERKRLKEILESFSLPSKAGFIIRTAGQGATKRNIQNDLAYLRRLWLSIQKKIKSVSAPSEIYQESDLAVRAVRDLFNSSIRKVICDNKQVSKRVQDFIQVTQPRLKKRVNFYDGKMPLFHRYKIEREIKKVQLSRVELESGGSLVIDQTEALVAIDVNSGKCRNAENSEQTALKINLEAAEEIARQLRIRDLGGLIIIDFIDMRESKHRRDVEKAFRLAVRNDRAHFRILKMSAFGLIEMTRQRMRPSLQSSTYSKCPVCDGNGSIMSNESITLEITRLLNLAVGHSNVVEIEIRASHLVAEFLLNSKRKTLCELEIQDNKKINVKADYNYVGSNFEMICYDERRNIVKT